MEGLDSIDKINYATSGGSSTALKDIQQQIIDRINKRIAVLPQQYAAFRAERVDLQLTAPLADTVRYIIGNIYFDEAMPNEGVEYLKAQLELEPAGTFFVEYDAPVSAGANATKTTEKYGFKNPYTTTIHTNALMSLTSESYVPSERPSSLKQSLA